MTLAGHSATILVTSTRDLGRIFTCLHDVTFDGLADFVGGIQKAQLALKHRQNTMQKQRIVAFVTSPIPVQTEALVRLGKNLKKNNVSVDIINIGLEGENVAKIDAFIAAVNNSNSSRALHVASGTQNLADALMQSDIYIERDAAGGAAAAAGGAGAGTGDPAEFPHGVDPSVDPELAMVLRISMEEERARQAAARETESGPAPAADAGKKSDGGAGPAAGFDENDDDLYGTGGGGDQMDVDDEDAEMLRRAIELSRAEAEQPGPAEGKEEDKSGK